MRRDAPCIRHPARAALLALALAACESAHPVPPVPGDMVRRLAPFDYHNTIRDVFGVEPALAREFPSDPPALGFDTVAAAQTTSALLVQVYQRSAESIADAVLRSPPARAALFVCTPDPADPSPCLGEIVDTLVTRAWRRPPAPLEHRRLLDLHARGRDLDHGLRLVVEAVLLSPHFAFRWERDLASPGHSHWLDDHALAARLSYLLWSSAPDDELLALAAAGALQDLAVLEDQVLRMLADPRAAGLVDGFAGQWLYIRGLDDVFRDAHRYPQFDDALRASMREALRRRFAAFLVPGRDFRELLTDTRADVDARLAALYRLDDVVPDDFIRLDLEAHRRRGLLTEPGLLTVLAYPFATSPTRRGRFVLEQLLCESIPPPPPGALASATSDAPTARERLAAHRADPACAGCHATLDPIGLAFEHFDAIGAWRGSEHGELIDAAGALPTGEAFADVRELADIIAADPRFSRCVARQVLTYALGRALVPADDDALEQVHARFVADGHDFVALLVAVVQSDPFRARRTQERP